MKSLRNAGRRPIAAAVPAILLGIAVCAPAAFAADHDEHAERIPMPMYMNGEMPMHMQLERNSTAMVSQMERCKIYERRFDDSVASHQSAAKIDEARTLRIEGGKSCGDGDYSTGVHKLHEALNRIGVSSML